MEAQLCQEKDIRKGRTYLSCQTPFGANTLLWTPFGAAQTEIVLKCFCFKMILLFSTSFASGKFIRKSLTATVTTTGLQNSAGIGQKPSFQGVFYAFLVLEISFIYEACCDVVFNSIKQGAWKGEVQMKNLDKPRHLSGWARRLWADGIGVAALLPLQAQKGTLPWLRLWRDNQHLRASRPPARAACWPQRNVNSQKKVLFDGYAAFIPLSRLGGTDPEKRCFCPRFEAQKTPPNRLCILIKWIFITKKWRQNLPDTAFSG